MTFSSRVKEELCRHSVQKKCCAAAECYGVLLFCNSWTGREARIVTESEAFAARLPILFRKAFHMEFDKRPEPSETGKRVFLITDPGKLAALEQRYGYDPGQTLSLGVNFPVVEEEHCKLAFCRGAFLAGGAVTDPEKNYHLEWVTTHPAVSRAFPVILRELGFDAKQTTRKANYVTYFKNSDTLCDILTALGAGVSAMELLNAKAEKDIRNGVNRRVNCDAANLDKVVRAAAEQIAAIARLEESGALAALPEKLRETARLRVNYPELTLTELAGLCDPPVSKSCLNHRLRKLMSLSCGEKNETKPGD